MHSLRILALSPLLFTATCASKPSNAVLLSDIQTLTLRNNRKTSARRVSARDQLSCIGGTAKGLFAIDVMRCKNSGSEYDTADVQWTCTASLPPEFRLGSTDVNCEGFDSPDDPYVLKGSCAVDYRLMLTAAGEARYGLREEPVSHKPTVVKNLLFYLVVACMFVDTICDHKAYGDSHPCSHGKRRLGQLSRTTKKAETATAWRTRRIWRTR